MLPEGSSILKWHCKWPLSKLAFHLIFLRPSFSAAYDCCKSPQRLATERAAAALVARIIKAPSIFRVCNVDIQWTRIVAFRCYGQYRSAVFFNLHACWDCAFLFFFFVRQAFFLIFYFSEADMKFCWSFIRTCHKRISRKINLAPVSWILEKDSYILSSSESKWGR